MTVIGWVILGVAAAILWVLSLLIGLALTESEQEDRDDYSG